MPELWQYHRWHGVAQAHHLPYDQPDWLLLVSPKSHGIGIIEASRESRNIKLAFLLNELGHKLVKMLSFFPDETKFDQDQGSN